MDCPRPIRSVLYHVVVANHEDTKVRGPGVEATYTQVIQNTHLDEKRALVCSGAGNGLSSDI